ncbi:cemA-like proton extrusion protein-like protein [Wolffia australiana]
MFLMSPTLLSLAGGSALLRVPDERLFRDSAAGKRPVVSHLGRMRRLRLVPNARRREKKKSWWQKLFYDEDAESWFGATEKDAVEDVGGASEAEEQPSEEEKFEAWRKRAEVITELREAQEEARNSGERHVWEDWLLETPSPGDETSSWDRHREREEETASRVEREGPSSTFDGGDSAETQQQLVGAVKNFLFKTYDDELLFEDKVFRYASTNSAKFLAFLLIVPWAVDFTVHDYMLMPFLDSYVEKVPLASQVFDVRRNQKLEMIKALKVEKARFRFEEEIGKAPPLSDEEVWLELREKAIELRDEWRLENRKAFANIWSDMAYGMTLFLVMYLNPNKVALLKFTGYKIINNISDTGKAFLIILITDIFLGYHSESGWEALVEAILEHYGFQVDEAAITVFVCFVPVVIDACVKLWLFKILPRLSPNVANIFREMKRH